MSIDEEVICFDSVLFSHSSFSFLNSSQFLKLHVICCERDSCKQMGRSLMMDGAGFYELCILECMLD